MKHTEIGIYARKTGIDSVKSILHNLPNHYTPRSDDVKDIRNSNPLIGLSDAIRMLDRTIGGLLANPASPFYKSYRTYTPLLFPSGLEATSPGKDIILILNSVSVSVNYSGKTRDMVIPPALKNPEKGVAQIIGHNLARALFSERGKILNLLVEAGGAGWEINAIANANALLILETYHSFVTSAPSDGITATELNSPVLAKSPSYPGLFDKPIVEKKSCMDQFFSCMRLHDDVDGKIFDANLTQFVRRHPKLC